LSIARFVLQVVVRPVRRGAALSEDVDDDQAWCDDRGWHYPPPVVGEELLTLALLEDISRLLVVHGYPPLRGHALAEMSTTLHRLCRIR
jgi:hypothetical protein